MSALKHTHAVSSTLFRLGAFFFLRVIPVRIGPTLLPILYAISLASLWWNSGNYQTDLGPIPLPPLGRIGDLCAIALSLPSASRRLRTINLTINVVLLLAAADFTLFPFLDRASSVTFTRVGAVYPDSAKIVVRYPPINATENYVRIVWREVKNVTTETWRDGPVLKLNGENDWVDTGLLQGLWPATPYEYKLSSKNRTDLPYPSNPIQFRTFPDPRLHSGNHFRFIVSSCVTPNFPYTPFYGRRIKGFDLLARYLFPATLASTPKHIHHNSSVKSAAGFKPQHLLSSLASVFSPTLPQGLSPPAEFLMFLGDFIYADVPAYIGDNKEAYRRLYRRSYQSNFRKIFERLPVFHTYDDHEIMNNFAGLGNDSTPPFPSASDAFKIYHANANYDSRDAGQYYYDFRYGDVSFFVMDTRRYRSSVKDTDTSCRTMLGDKQLAALYDWLEKANTTSTFKFIVSSVPFTSLWGYDAVTDAWAGYASEKTSLLKAFHSVSNVFILSGDRHEFASIEFNCDGDCNRILEFSTSPLSMFYVPFIRTLHKRSNEVVRRTRTEIRSNGNDVENIVTIIDEIPRERVIKYIGSGNYKWSAIEVDTRDVQRPTLHLEVMIDGYSAYRVEIIGSPVKPRSSTALGVFASEGLKNMLIKIGIKQTWF